MGVLSGIDSYLKILFRTYGQKNILFAVSDVDDIINFAVSNNDKGLVP